jgi:hypothetical protein
VVEGGFEAGVELLEFLIALEDGLELLLERKLQICDLLVRESRGVPLATWAVLPTRTRGKL